MYVRAIDLRHKSLDKALVDVLIYLSTAVGLTPGGSTHLHIKIHRTSQLTTKQQE
jgi:hypothetical protein